MNRSHIITSIIAVLTLLFVVVHRRRKRSIQNNTPQFTVGQAQARTIKERIKTSGTLRLKDSSKVGSLVSGTVLSIEVKEGQQVKKGQLLAVLDNGKKDTDIRAARGVWQRAKAEAKYASSVYRRKQALFKKEFVSEQELEAAERAFSVAQADEYSARAHVDKAELEYENTFIKAPGDGVVASVGIKKGFKVTTDLNATVLFEIARDITSMEVELEIDESDIAHVREGQRVYFTVDSYPSKRFKGTVSDIRFSPINTSQGMMYQAIVAVGNENLLLRPGMTVHATIKGEKARDTRSVPLTVFHFDQPTVEALASRKGMSCTPLERDARKACLYCDDKEMRCLWVVKDNTISERPVTVGTRDTQFIQILEGLDEDDEVLCDITGMTNRDRYKRMFRGAM